MTDLGGSKTCSSYPMVKKSKETKTKTNEGVGKIYGGSVELTVGDRRQEKLSLIKESPRGRVEPRGKGMPGGVFF